MTDRRRTWAEIDRGALRHNVAALRSRLDPAAQVMAVVKANAYGHGVAGVVGALAGDVAMFGVANVAEAREVRSHAPDTPVFILGAALPWEREEIVREGFLPSVSNVEEARAYAALSVGEHVDVHLILDTGMGRMGIWQEEAFEIAREIAAVPGLRVTGIASHLPVADEDEAFTREQLGRFHLLAERLSPLFPGPLVLHVENSAGILGFPLHAGHLVRAGLALYGSSPLAEFQPFLIPALTWKARITLVREVAAGRDVSYGRTFTTSVPTRIATLGVGYADGYRRHLSNAGAAVLIGGCSCAVLGRVTMDQILVDVSAVPHAQVGDEAVLIGRQAGEEILVKELADKAKTIAWDVFTGLGPRVERVFV